MSKSKINKKKLFKNIYEVVYVANIFGLIDEDRYIRILQMISKNGFKTYHVNDFDKLVIHLNTLRLKKSYTMSILLYLRDKNYQTISIMSTHFKEIKKHIKNNKNMVEKMNAINKILSAKLNIVRAFVKTEKIETIYSNNSTIPGITFNDNYLKEEWIHYNRDDIISRLHYLIKHFPLNQLIYMGVDLINIDSIQNTNTIDLQCYYDRTIDTIINNIILWKRACLICIDVNVGYLTSCHNIISGKEPELNLKMFTIIINKS